ncbi:MAG: hypothetical protein RL846_43165 [Deltaproteobacteria bacterium]|jgi:hypothetical protein
MMRTWVLVLGLVQVGCTAETGLLFGAGGDAGTSPDAGFSTDAGVRDGGRDGGVDPLAVLAGFECVATRRGGETVLARIDPLTAQMVPTGISIPPTSFTSLAWEGDLVVGCTESSSDGHDATLFDLASGEVSEVALGVPCTAVAGSSRGWVVVGERPTQIAVFDDFNDAVLGRASSERSMFVSRVGTYEDVVVGSWHAADEVYVTTFDDLDTTLLKLDGHDGWIMGVAPFPGGILLIGGLNEQELIAFDARTGRQIHRAPIDRGPLTAGLTCRPRSR